MKDTKNYEAPVAEMIEMQAPSVLMSSPEGDGPNQVPGQGASGSYGDTHD